MEALTPASSDDLLPLGELIADDPFCRYLASVPALEGIAHLRVWTTGTGSRGHLAVVTEIGDAGTVTESAGRIWAMLAADLDWQEVGRLLCADRPASQSLLCLSCSRP